MLLDLAAIARSEPIWSWVKAPRAISGSFFIELRKTSAFFSYRRLQSAKQSCSKMFPHSATFIGILKAAFAGVSNTFGLMLVLTYTTANVAVSPCTPITTKYFGLGGNVSVAQVRSTIPTCNERSKKSSCMALGKLSLNGGIRQTLVRLLIRHLDKQVSTYLLLLPLLLQSVTLARLQVPAAKHYRVRFCSTHQIPSLYT